jgi:ABC-type phosphate transport system substrate-binding protein
MTGVLFASLAGMAVTFAMQYRRLAWRVYLDKSIDLVPAQLRNMAARLVWQISVVDSRGAVVEGSGTQVQDPSLVVLRIRNAGIVHIEGKDFAAPLDFTFPDRTIKAVEVAEANGQSTEDILPPDNERQACGTSQLRLGTFPINRRDRFTVLVVLAGDGDSVKLTDHNGRKHGYLKGGQVREEKPRRGPITGTRLLLVTGTALAFALFALAEFFVLLPAPHSSSCAGGHLLLEGSTAFTPAAQQIARTYTTGCPGARVSVGGNDAITGTVSGLNALDSAGQQKPGATESQIAMSDGPVPAGYPGLIGHPVGVVIFTLVTNRQTGVFQLSTAQVKDIFDVIARSRVILCNEPNTSTLLQYVARIPGDSVQAVQLNGLSAIPGVAGRTPGQYHFWTVEYLYTYGTPKRGSLAAAYLSYMNSYAAQDILRSDGYLPTSSGSIPPAFR